MITGVNKHLHFEGTDYHIQVEDLEDRASLEVRVYVGGTVLFHRRRSYAEEVKGLADHRERASAVQIEMGKLLQLVEEAVRRGRIRASGVS